MGNGSGHERQSPGLAAISGLVFELGQERDLEIVEIMVISRQFPATTILHLGFDNVPVFIVVETVSRDGRCDGGHERWWVEILRVGMRDMVRGQRSFAGAALVVSLCDVSSVHNLWNQLRVAYIGVAILAHMAHRHFIHARGDGRDAAATAAAAGAGAGAGASPRGCGSRIEMAQCDAAILVFGRHFLPFLNLWNTGAPDGVERIGDGLTSLHVPQFEEGDRNKAGTTETTDRFGDKPFGVG